MICVIEIRKCVTLGVYSMVAKGFYCMLGMRYLINTEQYINSLVSSHQYQTEYRKKDRQISASDGLQIHDVIIYYCCSSPSCRGLLFHVTITHSISLILCYFWHVLQQMSYASSSLSLECLHGFSTSFVINN